MEPGPFELDSQLLGPLPVIKAFTDRLGLPRCWRRMCPPTMLGSG